MSREDLETARRGVEAFNRGDVEELIERADPDLSLVPVRSLLEGGEYRGHEGIRTWFEGYVEVSPDVRVEVERIETLPGNRILILGNQSGTAQICAAPFDMQLAVVGEYESGLLRRATT